MVEVEDAAVVEASPERVFAVVSNLGEYDRLTDDYSGSRVLEEREDGVVVERQGRVFGLPMRWVSLGKVVGNDRVEFVQLKGPLRGMVTVWRVRPEGQGTRVSIVHRYAPRFPGGDWLARNVVHRLVVGKMARRFLAGVERLMAQEARAEHEV